MRPHVFRAERIRMGMTQAQLALELGIGARQVRRYEAGKSTITDRTAKAMRRIIADFDRPTIKRRA